VAEPQDVETLRKKYEKGMRGLGTGLIVLGALQSILGAVAVVLIGDPLLMAILVPLATIDITLGIFARLQHTWVNYVVAVFASLMLILNCVAAGAAKHENRDAPPAPGSCLGYLILGAMIYTSINNLQTRSQLRKLEQQQEQELEALPGDELPPNEPPVA
jgi:hypothetical protein